MPARKLVNFDFNFTILSIGTLTFLLSSGFPVYFRVFGLVLIIISFCINSLYHSIVFNFSKIIPVLFFSACYLIGVVQNIVLDSQTTDIFGLTILLVVLFPIFLICYNSFSSDSIKNLIFFISKILAVLYFIIFSFLLVFNNSYGLIFVEIMKNFPGGYYYRPLGPFENFPLIWSQVSILFMPLAIFVLFEKSIRSNLFWLLSFVVFLSLNRTGTFIILFFYVLKLFKFNFQSILKIVILFFSILPIFFLFGILVLFLIYSENFKTEYSGFDIRLGHVLSVIKYLNHEFTWIYGMGADSQFMTSGWEGDGITRDQEISYLELLRRFGIVGFIFFNSGVIFALLRFKRVNNLSSFYSLISILLFSFTNPCLISLVFAIYFALISTSD